MTRDTPSSSATPHRNILAKHGYAGGQPTARAPRVKFRVCRHLAARPTFAPDPIFDMIDAARPGTIGVVASRTSSRRGRAWPSRQSRFSALLSLISAVALVALPGTGRANTGADVESWGAYPAIHATSSIGLQVAHRATTIVPSNGRVAPSHGVLLAPEPGVRLVVARTVSQTRPADPALAAHLVARGYDATAPPIA